jgi:hypothetical protein
MTSARTFSTGLLVSLLALNACGGSAKKVDPAADLALAKSAVLTKADLPGYTGKTHTKSDDLPAAVKRKFAACVGVPSTIFDDTPGAQHVDSLDFSKVDAQVSDSVEIEPKKSDVDTGWNEISKQAVAPCLKQLFQDALKAQGDIPAGVTLDTSVERFDAGVGSRSIGYALTVTVTGPAGSVALYIDLIFVARDRAGLEFSFLNRGAAVDRSLETSLAQKVYDRVGTKAK